MKHRKKKTDRETKCLSVVLAAVLAGGIYGYTASFTQAAAKDAKTLVQEQSKPTAEETDTTIYVSGFKFSGELPVSEQELQQVVTGSEKKAFTLKELEQQAEKVTRYLRSKGYFVAFAYVPAQDFQASHGLVQIDVVPGRYGKVVLDNKTRSYDSAVRRELGGVKAGAVVKKDELERAVWLIGDMAKTEAKTTLKAGTEKGTTDITVHVQPKGNQIWGYVGFDNGGYRDTGRYEYLAAVNYANPFREGDLFSLSGMHSNQSGMWSGNVLYLTPVFSQGNKIGIGYARSHYLLDGMFSYLGYTGSSDDIYVYWQTNFQRSRNANWYGRIRFDAKSMNENNIIYGNHKNTHSWLFGVNGDTRDAWGGGGSNTYSLSYTYGNLGIRDEAYADPATPGNYGKWNLSLTRLQRVRERLALWLSFSGQLANKNLDPSEKLSLGGPYGVRAYPPGEASGDDGWLGTAELRWNLPNKTGDENTWQLITFVDTGSVTLYKQPWSGYSSVNHRTLSGMGIGVNWSNESNWAARLHYAWKLGSEEAVSDTDRSGRLWFQLYKFF